VARSATALLNDLLHPVTKPAGEAKRRNDAADLILWIVSLVITVRGVMSVGDDAVADDQQVCLDPNEHVALDSFK